jgi:hypothetical protein
MTETWYLLFAGISVDGMGDSDYIGRTTDKSVARKHYDEYKSNPYSVGKVIAVTDTKHKRIIFDYDWEDL